LTVADTGIGIPHDQLPFVFDRFKRLGPEDEKGYGLGLPIVSSIATFQEIAIKVESDPGQGTTFELVFPKQSA
jgi:two-component system, OmpR family, sensor histidine kinase ArlS